MEVIRISARRIVFTEDELNILQKAKQILDDFNSECGENTCADDAAEMLGQFLNDDLRDGYTYIEAM